MVDLVQLDGDACEAIVVGLGEGAAVAHEPEVPLFLALDVPDFFARDDDVFFALVDDAFFALVDDACFALELFFAVVAALFFVPDVFFVPLDVDDAPLVELAVRRSSVT